LLQLLESNPGAQRDLLEFRHTLEGSCAYYAALRATPLDRQRLSEAYEALQACYATESQISRDEEGVADARFHLAIAEASHNAVLLHTIRGLFDLLRHNVVTNIGGLYLQHDATRERLREQHHALYQAIIEGRAEDARVCSQQHIDYVRAVLVEGGEEAQRMARAQRRQGH
jgi:GntR family transcriptional repressor for pyruvate dehydrogenase complex